MSLKAYACRVKGRESDEPTIVHALSPSKARHSYWLDVGDCLPDLPFIDVRCRCLGAPRDTARFKYTAERRGVWFHLGDKVEVNGELGYVGEADSAANFEVHLLDGRVGHWHPSEIKKPEEQL